MHDSIITTTRRRLFEMLAAGGGLAALGRPGRAQAQARGNVLVLGMDISDTITYDPGTSGTGPYTPLAIKLVYDTLVTMTPGDYVNLKPQLATAWQRTPDGKGLRFTLREGVKFNSGNPMTTDDVKWSFDRVVNMGGQPTFYLPNIDTTHIVDDRRVDILMKDPRRPILPALAYDAFCVYERKVLEAHGGDASMDAKTKDKGSDYLNQHSCGTGAYTMTAWNRGTSVQFERNPYYWGSKPAFDRVIIRHIADPAAQLLAIQRGDIDMALNLIPEQVAVLRSAKNVRIQTLHGLDMVYIALSANPDFNKVLAIREAREAVAWAIDYDGIRDNLLSGSAQRPASSLPIGALASTPEIAREIGYHQDLDKARAFLAKAGYPDGFSFKLTYGNASFGSISYAVVAQKVQSDLARIGIKAELEPQDPVTNRTQYNNARSPAIIQAWSPAGIDDWVWASATVARLAVRMHWTPPEDITKLVDDGNIEPDQDKQKQIWIQYQKRMVEEAYLWPLFQVDYQVAVSTRLKPFELNAAGWYFDVTDVNV